MGYMVRLGLWGEGHSVFRDFRDFLNRAASQTGTLELIATDMKARGMYVARTLSYSDAVFNVISTPLPPLGQGPEGEDYTDVYNK
jgi:hypothetical protein